MQAFLGCNKKIFSFDSSVIDFGFDGFTNFTFVSINPCSINISISFADCMLDSFSDLTLVTEKNVNQPETQTQPGTYLNQVPRPNWGISIPLFNFNVGTFKLILTQKFEFYEILTFLMISERV